ncbi:MAG: hypothetical protein ACON35_07970 [Candidatus Marinamargulisbacteria bacterium]
MNQNIEVKIQKLKINYIATADIFPKCKGIGKTKKQALEKLSQSISNFIASMVRENLDSVFSSENYTQILFDQSKEKPEEVIGFNMFNKQTQNSNLLFKFSEFSDLGEESDSTLDVDSSNINQSLPESLVDAFNIMDETFERDAYEQPTVHQRTSQDAIVFGFPLNFN